VFAGPNGSGKSTITKMANIIEPYINADEIKKSNYCTDLEAAQLAEHLRHQIIDINQSFTFETVLSTDRNLQLLKKAKEKGYFVRCIYVLTSNPDINISRVAVRTAFGGHPVPEEKIVKRYYKALDLVPQLLEVCDVFHIYDNSDKPFRIFKKRKDQYFYWENYFWSKKQIENLTSISL